METHLGVAVLVSVLCFLVWVWAARARWPLGRAQWGHLAVTGILMQAGYLGGVWVGLLVGAAAGVVYAFTTGIELAVWVFTASLFVGVAAGVWSRAFGTRIKSVIAGTIVIHAAYHLAVGSVMAAVNLDQAVSLASNFTLHAAKVAANVVGVVLFMLVLELARELERAREVAAASRDEARDARLEALQYQVRPHFLFNLLNTLAYLIRTDPPKARELTLELAEFLRYTLSRQETQTSLFQELAQIRRYVDLERARFGDGLQFDVVDAPQTLLHTTIVPPLILQPLVENAIRHGARDGRVRVVVEVRLEGDRVEVRVTDDGPGPQPDRVRDAMRRTGDETGGVGLRNVRERLERFYHGAADFELSAAPGGGARARFSIPAEFSERRGGFAAQARRRLEEVVS